MLPPAADNPSGFFEAFGVVGVNDWILREAGATWYDCLGFIGNQLEPRKHAMALALINLCLINEFPNASLLLPNTESKSAQVMVLPTGQCVSRQDIVTICNIIKSALEQSREVRRILQLKNAGALREPLTPALSASPIGAGQADGERESRQRKEPEQPCLATRKSA